MGLTAPYYTVGKQRAQWHKNKAEGHYAKAGALGVGAALSLHPSTKYQVAHQAKVPADNIHAVGIGMGVMAGGHAALGSYHAAKATSINRGLSQKRQNARQKNNFGSTTHNNFHQARQSDGNIS